LFEQRAMIPKDLLGLVFWELEDGHDMLNFSEISRRCQMIFHQNLEVRRTKDSEGDLVMFTQQKQNGWQHGLFRNWWNSHRLYQEKNYCHNQLHGKFQEWHRDGSDWTNMLDKHDLSLWKTSWALSAMVPWRSGSRLVLPEWYSD